MEVTPKTLADVKGGTLISYEDRVQVSDRIWRMKCISHFRKVQYGIAKSAPLLVFLGHKLYAPSHSL